MDELKGNAEKCNDGDGVIKTRLHVAEDYEQSLPGSMVGFSALSAVRHPFKSGRLPARVVMDGALRAKFADVASYYGVVGELEVVAASRVVFLARPKARQEHIFE